MATTWTAVRTLLELGQQQQVTVAVVDIPHPRDDGAVESVGLPKGQQEDWRFPPDSHCRGVHAQRFGDLWRVHIDNVHPQCSLVDHARQDAPVLYVATTTAIGLGLGALFDRPGIGAVLGTLFGAATSGRE